MTKNNERNQIIDLIEEWQEADFDNRMAFVVLAEGNIYSSATSTKNLLDLAGPLVSLMIEDKYIAKMMNLAVITYNETQQKNDTEG